jgi:hypothetical protein
VAAASFGGESVKRSTAFRSPRYFVSPSSFSSEFLQLFDCVIFSFTNPAFMEARRKLSVSASNKLAYSPYSLLLTPQRGTDFNDSGHALPEKLILTDDHSVLVRVPKSICGVLK